VKTGTFHDVAQGESVESIAAEAGHLPKTLWDAPENKALRDQRRDMHVLMPGDRLFVPPVKPKTFSFPTGSAKTFKVTRPPSRLKLALVKDGKPRANAPYRLTVDGVEERGSTDGNGQIDRPISPRAERATLVVGEGKDETRYELGLRALDPVTEVSGAQGRLRNLGYDVEVDGELEARTRAALAAFQQAEGVKVTGELDDATRAKLKERHGC